MTPNDVPFVAIDRNTCPIGSEVHPIVRKTTPAKMSIID